MVTLDHVRTDDQDLNRIQGNITKAFASLRGPFINGKLIQVALTSGQDNPITHNLGRLPVLWVICDQDTNSAVWRTAWDSKTLTLRCGTTCNVKVWVN